MTSSTTTLATSTCLSPIVHRIVVIFAAQLVDVFLGLGVQ